MTEPMRVRCYSCSHIYVADIQSIDTVCPECGSDSFTTQLDPSRKERHAQH